MSHSNTYDDDDSKNTNRDKNDNQESDKENKRNDKRSEFMPKEAMLELIESEDGMLVLRDIEKKEDPLVKIDFSDKIKDILGDDIQNIGQQMIHAAIHTVMNKQMKSWHAHVHDEEPTHYS